MLNRMEIARLVPHSGAMCLLDEVREWSAEIILCAARSHLASTNPLRRGGRLAMICGAEYGFQAAALHGALLADGECQRAGYLASLRILHVARPYLDEPDVGVLMVRAELEAAGAAGLAYGFSLQSEAGVLLLQGRGAIKLPPS